MTSDDVERVREMLADAVEVATVGPRELALIDERLAVGDVRGATREAVRALKAAIAEELDLALDEASS